MQEEYTGRLLEDGHLSIPKGIVIKLKIDRVIRLRVTVKVEGKGKDINLRRITFRYDRGRREAIW